MKWLQVFWVSVTLLYFYSAAALWSLTDYAFTPPVNDWYMVHVYITLGAIILLLGLSVFLYHGRPDLSLPFYMMVLMLFGALIRVIFLLFGSDIQTVPSAALVSGGMALAVTGLEVGGYAWSLLDTFWSKSVFLLGLTTVMGFTVGSAFAFREPRYTLTLDPVDTSSSYASFVLLTKDTEQKVIQERTDILVTPIKDAISGLWSFQFKSGTEALLAYRIDVRALLRYMRSQKKTQTTVSLKLQIPNDHIHSSFIRRGIGGVEVSQFQYLLSDPKSAQTYAPTQRLSWHPLESRSHPFYYYVVARPDRDGVCRWYIEGDQKVRVLSRQ